MNRLVCLIAAGRATRMGKFSAVNKLLLPIDGKAVLTHNIELFGEESEYVVVCSADNVSQVISYAAMAHPSVRMKFIVQPQAERPGPGTALMAAKHELTRPFFLNTADTLVGPDTRRDVLDRMEESDTVAVATVEECRSYCTFETEHDRVIKLHNKTQRGKGLIYTGLAFVKSVDLFFEELETNRPNYPSHENICAWDHPDKYHDLLVHWIDHIDIGKEGLYEQIVAEKPGIGLPKPVGDITYRVKDRVIKYFPKQGKSLDLVRRYLALKTWTEMLPENVFAVPHYLCTPWIHGQTLYEANSFDLNRLFIERYFHEIEKSRRVIWHGRNLCAKFFRDKTLERLSSLGDRATDALAEVAKINWEGLGGDTFHLIHGDLNPGNVIWRGESNFALIDWRDNFGDEGTYGSILYDYGKLLAGLRVDWFRLMRGETPTSFALQETERWFEKEFLWNEGANINAVKTVAALSVLSMAPIHPEWTDWLLNTGVAWLREISG